jgi:hypothetical protein
VNESPGDQLPKRFRLLARLGEGGMGTVYEALDVDRNTHVALKILHADASGALARFKREFRTLQDVQHPNLVALHELVAEGSSWFFTMELVRGVDFVKWCEGTPGPSFDEGRLRRGLEQLTLGLGALHQAARIHRDIKPANVLVTREGRVVILDFGLVAEVGDAAQRSEGTDIVGTPDYMAPEQAAGVELGPAADWYSVGVLLFQALTGRLPFEGSPALGVLLRKQREAPPSPRSINPAVPDDLNDLCVQLLHFEPASRPNSARILRILGAAAPPAPSRVSLHGGHTQGAIFVGREKQLDELESAYRSTRQGAGVTVLVRGASGVGKSHLVRRFIERISAADPDVVVLAGRCNERETVPYKALDGVIDALSRFLARLPSSEAGTFAPSRPESLLRLFPVLLAVPTMADQRALLASSADPHEVRRRAFAGARDMFLRVATRRKLIVVIDDLHWADADGIAMLAEILRPPDPPPMLLLCTTWPHGAGDGDRPPDASSALLADLFRHARELPLGPLSNEESRDLAERLLQSTSPDAAADTERIAREAEGFPLFVRELVDHLGLTGQPAARAGPTLDDALRSRIALLEEPARRLVELLAIADAPLPLDVLTHAHGTEGMELSRLVSYLRVAHLVRAVDARGDRIEPYHFRIRSAVRSRLAPEALKARHASLATALEASRARDPEMLAIHWAGAGNLELALRNVSLAAERAADKLAFDRAAAHYTHALRLRREAGHRASREEERALQRRLADALAKAGRGAAAGEAYRAASVDASEGERLELEQRAAQELVRSGHFDAGSEAIDRVLRTIGTKLPESKLAVIAHLLWARIVLWFRGYELRLRDPSLITARQLARLDAMWSLVELFGLVDVLRGRLVSARAVLVGLQVGDAFRYARAAMAEVVVAAQRGTGSWQRTLRTMEIVDRAARQEGSPYVLAWGEASSGTAHYLVGHYAEARARLLRAENLFREETLTARWENTFTRIFFLHTLAQVGALAELRERQSAWLRDAADRGDIHATVNMRIGFANSAWLVANDPATARAEVVTAMAHWSQRGTQLEHFYELVALTSTDLYEGRSEDAYRRVMASWKPIRAAFLTVVQTVRIHLWRLRGTAALGTAATVPARRSECIAEAEHAARRIERERAPWGDVHATMLRAGVAELRGEADVVVERLESAARAADGAEMQLVAAVARRSLAGRRGGDEGKRLAQESDAWMSRETVKDAGRLARIVAPWAR